MHANPSRQSTHASDRARASDRAHAHHRALLQIVLHIAPAAATSPLGAARRTPPLPACLLLARSRCVFHRDPAHHPKGCRTRQTYRTLRADPRRRELFPAFPFIRENCDANRVDSGRARHGSTQTAGMSRSGYFVRSSRMMPRSSIGGKGFGIKRWCGSSLPRDSRLSSL